MTDVGDDAEQRFDQFLRDECDSVLNQIHHRYQEGYLCAEVISKSGSVVQVRIDEIAVRDALAATTLEEKLKGSGLCDELRSTSPARFVAIERAGPGVVLTRPAHDPANVTRS